MKISPLLLTTLVLLCNHGAIGQNPDSSPYIEITYIKDSDGSNLSPEKQLQQNLVNDDKKSAWYFYKVVYPQGANAEYSHIAVSVFSKWSQLGSPTKPLDARSVIVWRQLYRLLGQAVAKESKPSRFIIANEVEAHAGEESEYVKLEQTYFKPFHTERALEGIMNNWGLYKREMPYGEKFAFDYVTFNGYATWDDITKQNPPTAWKKAHGDLNFNEIHDKILSKRTTVNVECWELLDYVVK
jgi:hypothetical protein